MRGVGQGPGVARFGTSQAGGLAIHGLRFPKASVSLSVNKGTSHDKVPQRFFRWLGRVCMCACACLCVNDGVGVNAQQGAQT